MKKPHEPQVRLVVEQFAVLKNDYTKLKEKFDAIMARYRDEVRDIKCELDKRASEIEEFEKYNIPKVFIMEIENKQAKKKYLKAVVRYYVEGEKKQKSTTLHLGQLSDFPNGIDDPALLELANYKAIDFVQRRKLSNSKDIIW